MRIGGGARGLVAALALAAAGALPAGGQEAGGGGLRAGFDVDLTARAGRDIRGGEDGGRVGLRLGTDLSSVTRTQRLVLRGGTEVLTFPGTSEDGLELGPLDLSLDYARQAARGRLTFSASVTEVQLDDVTALPALLDPDLFDPDLPLDTDLLETADGGTQRTARASGRLELGAEGAALRAAAFFDVRRTDYEDAPADREDSESVRLGAEVTGRVAPNFEVTLGVEGTEVREDGETDRTTRVRLGANYEATERLTLTGSLARVRRDEDGEEETGTAAAFGLGYELPRGAIGVDYARRFDLAGTRDELSVTRRIDLPGGDGLTLGVGAVRTEDGDVQATGSVAYDATLPRDTALALSAVRSVSDTTDGELATRTALAARLSRALTSTTSLQVTADYGRIDGTDADDSEVGALRAVLARDLPQDWRLSGGLEQRFDDGDAGPVAFLGLSRRFEGGF